jgi:hypothetical protein
MLDRGRSKLSSCEADLDTRDTALEVDRKSLGNLCVEVLACELTADLKANHLAFKEKELIDREKYFHRHCYKNSPLWFIVGGTKAVVCTSWMNTRFYVVRATRA